VTADLCTVSITFSVVVVDCTLHVSQCKWMEKRTEVEVVVVLAGVHWKTVLMAEVEEVAIYT